MLFVKEAIADHKVEEYQNKN